MATNQKALERQEQEKVEYDWGTLWPHYHKEKMNWATGFRTKGDVDILFLSGSTGRDPFEDGPCRTPEEERAGKGKVVGGIKEQTTRVLENIKALLNAAGADFSHVARTTVFMIDLGEFAAMNEIYATRVGDRPPARSTFQVAALPSGALVEIEAIAHL